MDSPLKFDKFGRPMLENGSKASVCEPDTDYYFDQPEVDYEKRLNLFQEHASSSSTISVDEFTSRTEEIGKKILKDKVTAPFEEHEKIIKLPICFLPEKDISNPGEILEKYLKIAKLSYEAQFASDKRKFNNYRKGNLAGKVDLVPGSRQELLLKALPGGGVGKIYICTQGFSINADRELTPHLPESFILSGLDLALAIAFYPDVLGRDSDTPGLDFAGLQSSGLSFGFWAYDAYAAFFDTDFLSLADGYYGGVFLVLG